MGFWKRLRLERLFLVPMDRSVAPGRLASSDGLARIVDTVRSCLASRRVRLPDGTSDEPVQAETVRGLGNRKNELVRAKIDHDSVEAHQGWARSLGGAHPAGRPPAAVPWSGWHRAGSAVSDGWSASAVGRAVRSSGADVVVAELVDGP